MKSKQTVLILGLAAILVVCSALLKERLFQSRNSASQGSTRTNELAFVDGGDLSNTDSVSNIPNRVRKRSGRIQRMLAKASSNTTDRVTGTLRPEEGLRVAEALETISALQDFLDERDDALALEEARALAVHPNREVRMAALEAMQWIGASAAADIALFFGDSDEEINQVAEEVFWDAISEMEDPLLQIKMLETSLHSPSPELRLEALDRLIYLPDHLSFPTIASMLKDSDSAVRDLAKDNLEFISEEEFESEAQAIFWFNLNKDELAELDSF